MSTRPVHLSWFTESYRAPAWNTRWEGTSSDTWASDPSFYVDLARSLERAKFDFMMFADATYVPDSFGGSTEVALKLGRNAPFHDPSVIIPVMATQTSRIGLAPTLTTTEWHPFHLARYTSTLDHLSQGRAGWNIVTGSNDLAAQNFGKDAQPPHDERYDMADEFVEVATRLWNSWEPGCAVADRETGYYVDHTKVHPIHHEGKYFRTRGPATTLPSPQGRPVMLQAGSSPRGRTFAAQHADVVLAHAETPERLKAYREEVRAQAVEFGRDPDSLKIFFIIQPILGDSDHLARERAMMYDAENEATFEHKLATVSRHWMIDFSKLDVDAPLSIDLSTNGHLGFLKEAIASGKSLREFLGGVPRPESELEYVGSPETVASQLAELIQETDADGIMFTRWGGVDRRFIAELTDGLVPVLQRRGITRDEYTGTTFRDHLNEF